MSASTVAAASPIDICYTRDGQTQSTRQVAAASPIDICYTTNHKNPLQYSVLQGVLVCKNTCIRPKIKQIEPVFSRFLAQRDLHSFALNRTACP